MDVFDVDETPPDLECPIVLKTPESPSYSFAVGPYHGAKVLVGVAGGYPNLPWDLHPLALDEEEDQARNTLRSGSYSGIRSIGVGTALPRGGVDGTVPQWLCLIAAELWMPAEQIAEHFRDMQRELMIEPDQPRTQARAFEVAKFVWEMEAAHGKRPSWPWMCKKWNDAPTTRPFKHWRDFKKYYVRGEKATLPQYKASDEQITDLVREATARGGSWMFDSWASLILEGTVISSGGRGNNVAAMRQQ